MNDRRYGGVSFNKGSHTWQASIGSANAGRRRLLGYYERPETAAWVADFARFLYNGTERHKNSNPPNFPPVNTHPYLRASIIRKVLKDKNLSAETVRRNLALYDRAAI